MKQLIIIKFLLLSFVSFGKTQQVDLSQVLDLKRYDGLDLNQIQFLNDEQWEASNRSSVSCYPKEVYEIKNIQGRIDFYCQNDISVQQDKLAELGFFMAGVADENELALERFQTICRFYKSIELCTNKLTYPEDN